MMQNGKAVITKLTAGVQDIPANDQRCLMRSPPIKDEMMDVNMLRKTMVLNKTEAHISNPICSV